MTEPVSPVRATRLVRVWDLPIRVFHWLLVLAVTGLVVTGNVGGDAMAWHFRLGYLVGSLLLFRWVWGFVGGRYARFTQFVRGPSAIRAYLRGHVAPEDGVGHNPLGALSVLAMLGMLSLQVGSGLFTDDEIAFAGPLVAKVSSTVVQWMTFYHKEVGKSVILLLVALHVAAIVYYRRFKQQNLVRPMLSGDQEVAHLLEASQDRVGTRLLALVLWALAMGLFVWIAKQG